MDNIDDNNDNGDETVTTLLIQNTHLMVLYKESIQLAASPFLQVAPASQMV
jgi:hypothetical protein